MEPFSKPPHALKHEGEEKIETGGRGGGVETATGPIFPLGVGVPGWGWGSRSGPNVPAEGRQPWALERITLQRFWIVLAHQLLDQPRPQMRDLWMALLACKCSPIRRAG